MWTRFQILFSQGRCSVGSALFRGFPLSRPPRMASASRVHALDQVRGCSPRGPGWKLELANGGSSSGRSRPALPAAGRPGARPVLIAEEKKRQKGLPRGTNERPTKALTGTACRARTVVLAARQPFSQPLFPVDRWPSGPFRRRWTTLGRCVKAPALVSAGPPGNRVPGRRP